jgi:uncharacterized protein (DUF433 family)
MTVRVRPSDKAKRADSYVYLERRPDSWRKQLYLKGRNMSVGQLVYTMRASSLLDDPVRAARNFELPVEQVREALTYYASHRDLIEREADEEKQWLLERGYQLEPDR